MGGAFWQNQIRHSRYRFVFEIPHVCLFPCSEILVHECNSGNYLGICSGGTWDLDVATISGWETLWANIIHQCGRSCEDLKQVLGQVAINGSKGPWHGSEQSRRVGEGVWAQCTLGLFLHLWASVCLAVKWRQPYVLWRAVRESPHMKHSECYCACFPCDGALAWLCWKPSTHSFKGSLWNRMSDPKIRKKKIQNLHGKKWNWVCSHVYYMCKILTPVYCIRK